jgi:hypothetical protein
MRCSHVRYPHLDMSPRANQGRRTSRDRGGGSAQFQKYEPDAVIPGLNASQIVTIKNSF